MPPLVGTLWQVYEAAAGVKAEGAGVLIEINGWRALYAIDEGLADE